MTDTRITIDAQIQMRHDTEANWMAADPVLRVGEPAYTIGMPDRFKIGDGQRKWSELPYLTMLEEDPERPALPALWELADVEIEQPVEGQALVYDEVRSMWVNRAVSAPGDEPESGPVFEFTYDTTTNKATAEMVSALAEAIAADKLIVCNGRTYKFILEQDGRYGLVSDAYMDITDGKLKASVLAVMASSYDVQLMEEEVPVGNGSGAEVRTLFVNDAGLSADELSYNAETVQLIFAQHPMIFFASAEEGTPLSEYELMGMDNGRMVFARYELDEYSTGATYIYLAFDGSTEVGGFSKSELDGDKYDQYLDANSTNAVQNKVVTENIRALEAAMPLMAVIDLDTIIAQDTPIDNATRNALLELGGYTAGDKYFSKGWIWSRGYLYTIKVIPTDAGVQIHVLSLKGWCEILEDNSKVNHLPSQGGGSIEVDAELSDTSENAVSNKAVTMALAETEEVTAAALNELNERFEEYATKEDLEDALADVSIEVDSAMSDTSENAVSNKVIKKYVDDADKSVKEYVDDADKSVKEYVDDADNALSERINALEQNSGGGNVEVDAELSESSTNAIANKAVTEAIVEDEEVISVALNQMNTRFDGYASLDALATEIQNAKDVIDASIIDNEEVAAAALVDLDKRLKDIIKILGNAGLI